MQDLLNRYSIHFAKRDEELYTLKDFFNSNINDKYHLPIIVKITSLNNYGRMIKDILTKNTPLLLINIDQLDSIIAEYRRSNDGRHHLNRHRLMIKQGKMATKASTKLRNMTKLSKSLASLTTINQITNSNDDDCFYAGDDGDDNTNYQRNLVKNLNEKRSSSISLCRLPIQYRRFFELLNEDDQSAEPYHKLTELLLIEYDDKDPGKRIEKWPHSFFLRSPCTSYKKKHASELFHPTTPNDQNLNSTANNDSFYDSSSDLDSQKNCVILNDEIQILQAGQILIILGNCLAVHARTSDKELKEQSQPSSPLHLSPTTWIKDKSKILFSKRRRSSATLDTIPNEINQSKLISKKYEPYLKCQTQQGDIVYIYLHESGLFSPLNIQTHHLKSNTESTRMDISGVFQLKNLFLNFRFPISIRHLEGSISFDNIYSPASINRHGTPTKLRLLMPYNEQVIFACPLNLPPSKSSKTSPPNIVIPLSINADIQIQPCTNMHEISRTEEFHKLIDICFQLIEQYQNEISIIHFPLQCANTTNRRKQLLHKKRSQSESFIEYFDDSFKHNFRHSTDQLNYDNYYVDNLLPPVPSPLYYRESSIETVKEKFSTDTGQQTIRHSDYYKKIKNNKQKSYSHDEYTVEDEIYEDIDKIYDYVRSGDITGDVEKIQAKDRIYTSTDSINSPSPKDKKYELQIPKISPNPGQRMTHRFAPVVNNSPTSDNDIDFHSCKNDGNVDDDQAHALYLASKQRTKANSQDYSKSQSTTKIKRITKH